MPVWIIAAIGAVLFLIVAEEAGNFLWKRYVFGRPEKRRRNFDRFIPRRVRESIITERLILAPGRLLGRIAVRAATFVRADRAYAYVSRIFSRMKRKLLFFAKNVLKRFISILKVIFSFLVKAVRYCFESASVLIRKYRKSSSHL
ncbi:hypothetical protein D1B31_15010 [Neobacillus notoginsengisoli]|uniref:Uncharacterized protein n=1 Tax=Neobacillus notoginsengisoli TaxID=1578198 RepID=A0A417YS21_9BACI|nr:hypothetical protein [Neobacillus notoginsengisoli]RHW38085.1 hypothetical protein D1B31_15010 [Neobacillus notoginsengisoli]